MEVAPGIHRIEVPLGERVLCLYLCLYLLAGEERALLVDTGQDSTPREHLLPALSSLGLGPRQIRYVLITHSDWDHQGGNVSIRELAPYALLMCHELDRPLIESIDWLIDRRYGEFWKEHRIGEAEDTKAWIRKNNRSETLIDVTLAGGEEILLGEDWRVQVWHVPGHSTGHLSIYDPKSRAAIIADAALWNCVPTRDGKPSLPPTYRYVEAYLSTLRFFEHMPIKTLLTSHYPVLEGPAVAEFLTESRAFADRLEFLLRHELTNTSGARTTRDLVDTLSSGLGSWPAEAGIYLVYPLVGHLERLLKFGIIEKVSANGIAAWKWKS